MVTSWTETSIECEEDMAENSTTNYVELLDTSSGTLVLWDLLSDRMDDGAREAVHIVSVVCDGGSCTDTGLGERGITIQVTCQLCSAVLQLPQIESDVCIEWVLARQGNLGWLQHKLHPGRMKVTCLWLMQGSQFGSREGHVILRGKTCSETSWSDTVIVCTVDTDVATSSDFLGVHRAAPRGDGWWDMNSQAPVAADSVTGGPHISSVSCDVSDHTRHICDHMGCRDVEDYYGGEAGCFATERNISVTIQVKSTTQAHHHMVSLDTRSQGVTHLLLRFQGVKSFFDCHDITTSLQCLTIAGGRVRAVQVRDSAHAWDRVQSCALDT